MPYFWYNEFSNEFWRSNAKVAAGYGVAPPPPPPPTTEILDRFGAQILDRFGAAITARA